jgi:hypothetical protein
MPDIKNDIFVLYKQPKDGVPKLVETFLKELTQAEGFSDFTVKDYDDSLPDDSYYVGTRSLILLCVIDDEWFYDPLCIAIWKYFWGKQTNGYKQQILFPVLVEEVKDDNFDNVKKSIYKNASDLGFYRVYSSDLQDIDELRTHIADSIKSYEEDGESQGIMKIEIFQAKTA